MGSKPVQRVSFVVHLDTDGDPAKWQALDPVHVGRAVGDVLTDVEPFEIEGVEYCFITKVTKVRAVG